MNPKIIILGEASSEDMDYYDGYNTISQNSAGTITFECIEQKVHVFVSEIGYSVDFLENENMDSEDNYIGSLII